VLVRDDEADVNVDVPEVTLAEAALEELIDATDEAVLEIVLVADDADIETDVAVEAVVDAAAEEDEEDAAAEEDEEDAAAEEDEEDEDGAVPFSKYTCP
jgi:hypothetical protein